MTDGQVADKGRAQVVKFISHWVLALQYLLHCMYGRNNLIMQNLFSRCTLYVETTLTLQVSREEIFCFRF